MVLVNQIEDLNYVSPTLVRRHIVFGFWSCVYHKVRQPNTSETTEPNFSNLGKLQEHIYSCAYYQETLIPQFI